MTQDRLDRLIETAKGVLSHLDAGAQLSFVLPTVRLVAELAQRQDDVHWIDFEIYGVDNVPGQKTPLETASERRGFMTFWQLHSAEDLGSVTVEKAFKDFRQQNRRPTEKTWLVPQSIYTLENSIAEFQRPDDSFRSRYPDEALRLQLSFTNQREIVQKVRAHVHRFVSTAWRESIEEKENLELLGPDYRLVVQFLDALDTDVGNELRSALSLIRSENPADWSAAALQCRNVVLHLGRTLFPKAPETYHSKRLNRDFDLSGEKEKNRLHAFLEEVGESVDKEVSTRGHDLIDLVYERGSKGKSRTVRHAEAQSIVVDTFELVTILIGASDLKPLE